MNAQNIRLTEKEQIVLLAIVNNEMNDAGEITFVAWLDMVADDAAADGVAGNAFSAVVGSLTEKGCVNTLSVGTKDATIQVTEAGAEALRTNCPEKVEHLS